MTDLNQYYSFREINQQQKKLLNVDSRKSSLFSPKSITVETEDNQRKDTTNVIDLTLPLQKKM